MQRPLGENSCPIIVRGAYAKNIFIVLETFFSQCKFPGKCQAFYKLLGVDLVCNQ